MLLKKFCGEEGEKVDVQKLFGYLGLFSLIALWWLGNISLFQINITEVYKFEIYISMWISVFVHVFHGWFMLKLFIIMFSFQSGH